VLSFLNDLNEKQSEAALAVDGPLLILAGAGSGKTKTLTTRIAHLIQDYNVPAYRILAVTFTNKAAGEMRERVARMLRMGGDQLNRAQPDIGTFHSVCIKILRREMEALPFSKPFVIYDDSDQLSLVKSTMERLQIDSKAFNPKSIQGIINRAKCDAIEFHEMEVQPFDVATQKARLVYEEYQKSLIANNALDFGEILSMTYRLFRDRPDIRTKYQKWYPYIHVDEYQDTNRVQYLLLKTLAHPEWGGHRNLCVVGDEDQSIYSWRGADIQNILDFEKDYPDAVVVKLEQNYRSSKTIINGAVAVISNNLSRKDKTLWTANDEGDKIQRVQLLDERTEARFVVSEVKRMAANDGYSFGDFAIFYRTNAQSRQFEDLLRLEKIAYQIIGGFRFYERKEIKDILSYFKMIFNADDSVSLKRVLNVPARGIGKTTIEKLEKKQSDIGAAQGGEPVSLWTAIRAEIENPEVLNAGTAKKCAAFVDLIQELQEKSLTLSLPELYHLLLDKTALITEFKKEGTDEALGRIENLEELDTVLQEFVEAQPDLEVGQHLATFLEQTTLASDVDQMEAQVSTVKLMTLHSSKGLEFPVVFLVGMEEGIFPSGNDWEEEDLADLEEERRLCYVGMTRAEKRLIMTNAVERRIWGRLSFQKPSRFFDEIPERLVEYQDRVQGASGQGYGLGRTASASSGVPQSPYVGRVFLHPEYGKGRITLTEGFGPDERVTVEFNGRIHRKFLVRFVQSYIEE